VLVYSAFAVTGVSISAVSAAGGDGATGEPGRESNASTRSTSLTARRRVTPILISCSTVAARKRFRKTVFATYNHPTGRTRRNF
jgi:hypothetical protein